MNLFVATIQMWILGALLSFSWTAQVSDAPALITTPNSLNHAGLIKLAITPQVAPIYSITKGVIYGVGPNNDLLWYRHDGRTDGSFRWPFSQGKQVGVGWVFKHLFSGGNGIIYGIKENGDLLWYRHEGRADGSFRWPFSEGKTVGIWMGNISACILRW
ncbi:MAG: hypothetical protein DMG65_24820 [Candidatus Angelobacter sp. Gp1-AA117]|nr:MAG: hypothetical protein DMG65_24820 [Candidatus Angelobacter sp. Gp1-AA117]